MLLGLHLPDLSDSSPSSTTNPKSESASQSGSRSQLFLPDSDSKIMDVQMQCGESDCGLFAISFATALVFREQLGHFLRSHLMRCFEQQQMSMFSIRKGRHIHSKVKTMEKIPIYCACCMLQLLCCVVCVVLQIWCCLQF